MLAKKRVVLTSLVIFGVFFSILRLQAVEEQASKGSLIEASFILQNKVTSLKVLRQKLSLYMNESVSTTKRLEQEKIILEKGLSRSGDKSGNQAEHSQIILSLHQSFLYANTFRQAFYPEFIQMIDHYSSILSSKATTLQEETLPQNGVKKLVEEANFLHDLMYAQNQYVADLLDLRTYKNKIKNEEYTERSYKKMLADRSAAFDVEKTKEYAKLKQHIKTLHHTAVEKQREINKLKQTIADLYKKLETVNSGKFSKEWFYKQVIDSQKKAESIKK
ncbi:hypothetical protein H0X48_06120 [Candidatus Dependentiae bacterium]|nr:hypothetical protein [Candidatus Dependentiae bacterium]